MKTIVNYLVRMLPYILLALPMVLLVRILLNRGRKKRGEKTSLWHEAGVCLFVLFLVGLASLTVIPRFSFGMEIGLLGSDRPGRLNLIPGMVFLDTWRESVVGGHWLYFWINFVGNIVMFMPIGFAIPLLWREISFRKTVLLAFAGSLLIEICQYPQGRGSDLDDLWLNTLGAILGYLLFALCNKRLAPFFERWKRADTPSDVDSKLRR